MLGWIGGIAWHLQLSSLQSTGFYAVWMLLVLIACCAWVGSSAWRRRHGIAQTRRGMACLSSLCLLALAAMMSFGVVGWRAAHQEARALAPRWEGQDLQLMGVVTALPHRTPESVRFRFRIERAWVSTGPFDASWSPEDERRLHREVSAELPTQVLLGWHAEGAGESLLLPDLRAGDRWRLPVRLKAPHGQINPHGFDFEGWMWSQGLQAVGYVRPASIRTRQLPPLRLDVAVAHPVERLRQAARDRLWSQGLDPRLTGILSALLLGDQGAIDPVDWDVFRRTGVAHLMSISGLHITMLAAVVRALLGLAWSRATWQRRSLPLLCPAQRVGELGGWWVAWLYSLFSGWGLPAQRTVIMLGVGVLLNWRGRHWPWPWVLLLACAAVLTWDPWACLQAGFWLSFVAVGILMLSEDAQSRRDPNSSARPGRGSDSESHLRWEILAFRPLQSGVIRLLREQWLMTLCLAPLTLLLFHQVSTVGLLANVLAIPWVTFLVTPLVLGGVVWSPAWSWGAMALGLLQDVLAWWLSWGMPSWDAAVAPVWVVVVGVGGAVLLWRAGPWGLRWCGVPCLLPVLLWSTPQPREGEVEVLVVDVGQGQSVLVRTAGHALLYDAGPRYSREMDAGQRVIVPLLQALNIRLNRLVLSHRDTDHTGGAEAVLAMQTQATVLGSLPRSHRLAQRPGYRDCEVGVAWIWEGVRFEVLHPTSSSTTGRDTSNAWSCVLSVRTARSHLLLAGDIEAPEESVLVQRLGAELKADVLLMPHHGSQTSSTAAFLEATQARWAWVQAGYRNRYGHPAPAVMARYQAHGIEVIETSRCGAILWSSAKPQDMLCERMRRQRYWHHRLSSEAGARTAPG